MSWRYGRDSLLTGRWVQTPPAPSQEGVEAVSANVDNPAMRVTPLDSRVVIHTLLRAAMSNS